MYARPIMLFPLVALGLLALLTLWIDHTVQETEAKPDGSTRHDPDYYMSNFETTKTNINGELQYRLSAELMKHYPDDDSTQLVKPKLRRYTVDKPFIDIESDRGSLSGDGEIVEFFDNVVVVREASEGRGEMTVLTEQLTVHPKKDLATTDLPVVIKQAPKTVVNAVGMIFDKKNNELKLLDKVVAHYESPRKTKGSYNGANKKTSDRDMKIEMAIGATPLGPKSKISPAPSQQPDPELKFSKEVISN